MKKWLNSLLKTTSTFACCLLALVLIFMTQPAKAWDSMGDSLRICNNNKTHDVWVAYVAKAVPWGIAALIGAGWHRGGWWFVEAGRCEFTMPFKDVKNYEIWLYVAMENGEQIQLEHSMNEGFCIRYKDHFKAFAWSKKEIQSCPEGEQLATYSYMTSLYNVDDKYSIYQVQNQTLDLNFTYDPAKPKPAIKQHKEPTKVPQAKQEPNTTKPESTPSLSKPVSPKLVQICTPLLVDRYGNFFPLAKKAIDNGEMERHFADINEIINAIKNDSKNRLNQILINETSHVQLIVPLYFEENKSVKWQSAATINELQCPSGYRQYSYDAAQWLKRPDLSPQGLQTK